MPTPLTPLTPLVGPWQNALCKIIVIIAIAIIIINPSLPADVMLTKQLKCTRHHQNHLVNIVLHFIKTPIKRATTSFSLFSLSTLSNFSFITLGFVSLLLLLHKMDDLYLIAKNTASSSAGFVARIYECWATTFDRK